MAERPDVKVSRDIAIVTRKRPAGCSGMPEGQ